MVIKGNPFADGAPLTIGELMALLGYVGGLVWPIEMIGWLANGISRANASIKRINNIYEQLPQIEDQSPLTAGAEDGIADRKTHRQRIQVYI